MLNYNKNRNLPRSRIIISIPYDVRLPNLGPDRIGVIASECLAGWWFELEFVKSISGGGAGGDEDGGVTMKPFDWIVINSGISWP